MRSIKVADLRKPWPDKRYIEVYVKIKSKLRHSGYNTFFHVNLCDDSGEIKASIFNFACERYYESIQMGRKYRIANGDLRASDRRYTNLTHEHVIYFTNSTTVTEYHDDTPGPELEYNFIPISKIPDANPGSYLDVIGIVKDAGEIQIIGHDKIKRIVILTDQSGGEVNLVLWNEEAVDFETNDNLCTVVLLKDARVKEFRDVKDLDMNDYIFLNPDIPRAHELKYWHMTTLEKWVSIYDAINARSDESVCFGTVTDVSAYSHIYKACVTCKTKMKGLEEGLYKCNKCNMHTNTFKKWLVLRSKIADPNSELKISAFSDVAETMLGKTTEEICNMALEDDDAYSRLLEDLRFKSFVFKLKPENDEATVISVRPMNCKEVATRILTSVRANKFGSIVD